MIDHISMNKYSEMYYEFKTEITQGDLIPFGAFLKLTNENQKALLIIENACNLQKQGNQMPTVDMVEYINLFDPIEFIIFNGRVNGNVFLKIIQNRDFHDKLVYLPVHDSIKHCKKCSLITITEESIKCMHCGGETEKIKYGLVGLCNKSGYIPLSLLKKIGLKKYLCVKIPYRDYIKNKYTQFKLNIPIKTITEKEAKAWIINNVIQDLDTPSLGEITRRLKLSHIEEIIDEMVAEGSLNYEKSSKEYNTT